jgi:hypothetical protein
MNGIHFYQEFRDESKGVSAGTVVAALVCNGPFWSSGKICFEAVVGLFDHANSVVCGGSVSLDYLREKCRRIGETQARAIHPALFERLDQPEHDQEKSISTSTKASRVR